MPVVKHDDSPSSHASVIGWIQFGGLRCIAGQTHGVIAVEHTSMPANPGRGDLLATMLTDLQRRPALADINYDLRLFVPDPQASGAGGP